MTNVNYTLKTITINWLFHSLVLPPSEIYFCFLPVLSFLQLVSNSLPMAFHKAQVFQHLNTFSQHYNEFGELYQHTQHLIKSITQLIITESLEKVYIKN